MVWIRKNNVNPTVNSKCTFFACLFVIFCVFWFDGAFFRLLLSWFVVFVVVSVVVIEVVLLCFLVFSRSILVVFFHFYSIGCRSCCRCISSILLISFFVVLCPW